MPDAINKFVENRNIAQVRDIQRDIHALYRIDASQYDEEKKLVIRKVYDLIPSNMENKKKRIVVKKIEGKAGHKQFSDYADEFEFLTNSGVALAVRAISNPKFPLIESESKNLLKLYLSDVGLLTNLLYSTNVNAVLRDVCSVNLGSVYESMVAQELHAHGFALHYYDNKQRGEVDFLIDDFLHSRCCPLRLSREKIIKCIVLWINLSQHPIFTSHRPLFLVMSKKFLPIKTSPTCRFILSCSSKMSLHQMMNV